jgi:hypothetical protein
MKTNLEPHYRKISVSGPSSVRASIEFPKTSDNNVSTVPTKELPLIFNTKATNQRIALSPTRYFVFVPFGEV